MARESRTDKLIRMTELERTLWAKGCVAAGIDEVGRGPLAGPVVTACVVMRQDALIPGVDDSKKLSPMRREALAQEIWDKADFVRVARVEAAEIDKINILNATKRAMEECAREAAADIFLVDAMQGLALPGEIRSLIHGDAISYMIAAASIVAKVFRDRLMVEMDAVYPGYGFAKHKGYGTPEHIKALRRLGPCPEHRRSFITKILEARA